MTKVDRNIRGFDYFKLVLASFIGLLLDPLLGFGIAPIIFGKRISEWSNAQFAVYWMIVCFIWGIASFFIIKFASNKYDFDFVNKGQKMEGWKWATIISIIVFTLMIKYFNWNGVKIFVDFQSLGWVRFIFQYLYYCFEVLLVVLILIFGQTACEKWFKKINIPYGGIIIAITWGLAHFFTKDFLTGIMSVIVGLAYGSIYLLTSRDIRKTYIILWIMFVL